VVASVAFFGWVLGKGIQAQLARPRSGGEALIGALAVTVSPIAPEAPGQVRLHGELWTARSTVAIAPNTPVRVLRREGLTLWVEPVQSSASQQ